jgi:signal transduction histidine kinase
LALKAALKLRGFVQSFGGIFCASIFCLGLDELNAVELSGSIRYDGPLEGNIIVQAWVPKPDNRALQLDGKTGYVLTHLTDLSGPELTIQFWFKGRSIQSAVRQQNGGLQDFEEEWNGRAPSVIHNPPRGWIIAGWHGFHLVSHDGLLNGIYYDADVTDEHWHHVAMTWKQNTRNGFASYMDGRVVSRRDTRDSPIPNYNSPIYFGTFAGGSEFTDGLLDEISIWKRALPESEISNSWHHLLTGSERGLTGYWNFDDGSANDSSPNRLHGQLRGEASIVDAEVPGLGSPVLSTRLTKPGDYRLTNLVAQTEYRIVAFLDVNGNRVMDPWEPRSVAASGRFQARAKAERLDLHLGIPVPFWRSGWFFGLAGFGSIMLVGGFAWFIHSRKARRRFEELKRQHQLEHERWRIARDIHDELGAKLTRISYLSEVAKCATEAERRPGLEVLGTATRDLLRTLDTIVWAISPKNDTLENLVEYACQYATEFFSMTGVECQVIIPVELPQQILTSQVRHELFRVIQESLNNILKHANATRMILKFEVQNLNLHITISDNGSGFDSDNVPARRAGGGNGHRIMRERLIDLGGVTQMKSARGEGTTLLFVFPMSSAAQYQRRELTHSTPTHHHPLNGDSDALG